MIRRIVVLFAVIVASQAGGVPATYAPGPTVSTYSAAPAVSHITYSSPLVSYNIPFATQAITSQSSNIHRSYGNLGQVSTYSKTIDTPFSSVSKADVRVSNPGLKFAAAAPVAYAAPAPVAYAAPAPVAYAAHPPPAPLAYAPAAPVYSAGPAQFATGAITSQSSNIHRSFGNLGQISTYSKTIDTPFSSVSKADVRVSNPGLKFAAAAPAFAAVPAAPAAAPLLGVAYSAAPAVAHVIYAANVGSYEW